MVNFNANFVWDFEIKRYLSEEFHEVSKLAKSIIFIKEFKEASVEFSYGLRGFEEATDLLRSVSSQLYFILHFRTLSQIIRVLTLGRIPSKF